MPFVADEFSGRIFGSYEVMCRLAVGGMAEIFLGAARRGPFQGRPVVLKRILQEQREDPASLQMLIDEAKVTATLSHAHIAQVLDLERAGDEVLLVIEFIRGANLEELVEVSTQKKEPLPLGLVLAVIRDAAMGLQHAHSHKPSPIMHRDVTPRNVMVDFDGIGKVLDFGIARAAGASRRTVAGMVRGTSAYMSPEQAVDGKIDTRSDIFSLGIIFHELLVGQRLFYRGNPGKEMAAVYEAEIPVPSIANRRVPKALDAVVLRALERAVARRYQSATELMRDLALAAGSTTWSPERCSEFVRSRFAQRKSEIDKLLLRLASSEQAAGLSTVPARVMFPMTGSSPVPGTGENEPRTVVDIKPAARTSTIPGQPPNNDTPAVAPPPQGPVPRKKGPNDTDESAAPTRFFTPTFEQLPAAEPEPERRDERIEMPTDERSVVSSFDLDSTRIAPPKNSVRPTEPAAPRPSPSQLSPPTQPGVLPVSQQTPAARPVFDTDVARGNPPAARSGIGAWGIIGALAAMVLGAVSGVLIYRSFGTAPPPTTPPPLVFGVGRLTLSADRRAEVKFGDRTLGTTPLTDLYVPAGKMSLQLRENGGPWRQLDIDVKQDQVNRIEVRLDSLPALP